jgi:hypothetical protein
VEETDAENQGAIHSNTAAGNPMFATWQLIKKWK